MLGISLLATTGPVRNSSLSKGKAEEISLQKIVPNTANRTQINFPFLYLVLCRTSKKHPVVPFMVILVRVEAQSANGL